MLYILLYSTILHIVTNNVNCKTLFSLYYPQKGSFNFSVPSNTNFSVTDNFNVFAIFYFHPDFI